MAELVQDGVSQLLLVGHVLVVRHVKRRVVDQAGTRRPVAFLHLVADNADAEHRLTSTEQLLALLP